MNCKGFIKHDNVLHLMFANFIFMLFINLYAKDKLNKLDVIFTFFMALTYFYAGIFKKVKEETQIF